MCSAKKSQGVYLLAQLDRLNNDKSACQMPLNMPVQTSHTALMMTEIMHTFLFSIFSSITTTKTTGIF